MTNPPKGYLLDTRTGERMEFQYNPQPIRDRKGVNVNQQIIPGASDPVVTPSSGGPRTIEFDLTFYAEDGDPGFVEQKINFLRSLEYPDDGQNFETYQAPLAFFIYGRLYKLGVYINQLDIRFDDIMDPEDLRPWYAFCTVRMIEAPRESIRTAAVRTRGRGFRVNT